MLEVSVVYDDIMITHYRKICKAVFPQTRLTGNSGLRNNGRCFVYHCLSSELVELCPVLQLRTRSLGTLKEGSG